MRRIANHVEYDKMGFAAIFDALFAYTSFDITGWKKERIHTLRCALRPASLAMQELEDFSDVGCLVHTELKAWFKTDADAVEAKLKWDGE